jgi:salicylate hydroxylase
VILKDGEVGEADLIVGADGIHSQAVKYVLGHENQAMPTGLSCFRFLIDSQELLGDEETRALMDGGEGKFRCYVDKIGRRFVWYPCRR